MGIVHTDTHDLKVRDGIKLRDYAVWHAELVSKAAECAILTMVS